MDGSVTHILNGLQESNNSGPTNNEDYTLINTGESGMSQFDGYWNDADEIFTYKL